MRLGIGWVLLGLWLAASTILAKWHTLPSEVFKGQIFPATIQFLSPSPDPTHITFSMENGQNIKLVFDDTPLTHDDLYYYKTFYFKMLDSTARLPDILIQIDGLSSTLPGKELQATPLKAPQDFCNVLAKRLQLLKHEEVQYNANYNLVVMKLSSLLGNIEDFHLPWAKKEEIKELNLSFPRATAIYYAIIPATLSQLAFSYFDTDAREFRTLRFDIHVKDETVSTQSDIKPTEDKYHLVKLITLGLLGATLLLVGIFKRSFLAFLMGVGMAVYVGYMLVPLQKICVKKNSRIYILPTRNSTAFEVLPESRIFLKLNEVDGYAKIKLSNDKIGWVKNEDICED